jgi:glucose dehydrogenase
MRHHDNSLKRHREHHPAVSIGLFFIVLGLALLVATNDMLHLGSVKEYFTWETLLIFLGALMLLNLRFIPGLLLIAGGIWFIWDNHYGEMPQLIKTIYWPAVIMLMGLLFIISSFFKRKNVNN